MRKQELLEKYFKKLYVAGDRVKMLEPWLTRISWLVFFTAAISFSGLFIYYIGFPRDEGIVLNFSRLFRSLFLVLWGSKYITGLFIKDRKITFSFILRIILFLFSTFNVAAAVNVFSPASHFTLWFRGNSSVIITSFLLVISESAVIFDLISRKAISPSLVFAGSFLFIIFLGAGLLLLPNAHRIKLSFNDALFTSVSAVCVTGLVVVDTASAFTTLGKVIILCLIQAGGLGIMTFTGFFSYIFTSRSSIQERLLLKNIFSSKSLGNLFRILTKIILITFLTELAGAAVIYSSLDSETGSKVLFSVFHSVSAFCNAGFSTVSTGLSAPGLRDNLIIQTVFSVLIIMGGIGFPVLLKSYSFIKSIIKAGLKRLRILKLPVSIEEFGPGGRIAIKTTLILIIGGTLLYFLLEKDGAYSGMSLGKKLFSSFFDSVTARTAGFSVHSVSAFAFPAISLTIMLMWIGASPGSTGGGIKTTTFAIAVRNAWSSIRGRERLEISRRSITHQTVSRVLSIIILSVIVIGTGFFFLLIYEKGKHPLNLLFEAFSAFGTVGLSMADTPSFSSQGKTILILLMFIGRIGPLTLLTGFFSTGKRRYYSYPESDITIN